MTYTPREPCTCTLPCRISTCIFFDECDWTICYLSEEEGSA